MEALLDERIIMPYVPVPEGSILDECEHLGERNGIKRWRSCGGKRIFTWDPLHGEIEVFNKRGQHLGTIDPISGLAIKPAVKGRKIDV